MSDESTIHNVDPLEVQVFQLVTELLLDPDGGDAVRKMHWLAEVVEKAEAAFRQSQQPAATRRDGHLIGHLFRILDEFEDFYTLLERKLQGASAERVRNERVNAAVCRLLLATAPVKTRFIVRLMYEEDVLDRVCRWAEGGNTTTTAPPASLQLQCYAAGLLSVGLRDRSIADNVVNHETLPVNLLRRARYYAMALENERNQAVDYMHTIQKAAMANSKHKKSTAIAAATKKRRLSIEKYPSQAPDVDMEVQDISERLIHSLPSPAPENATEHDTSHEEPQKQLLLLDLLYTLECLGLMGEYLELLAPAIKEDILGTIITFLHSHHPTLWSATLKLTSHFLAHKKFAFLFLENGGLQLVLGKKTQEEIAQLHRSMSMVLHGFASSTVVMESIFSRENDRHSLLRMALALLGSPHDKARQNAVVFFGLVLPFRAALEFFEQNEGVYVLLNLIRAGNQPKNAIQRQLAHDACLCLRQYVRVHFGIFVYALQRKLTAASRLPKLSQRKPVDIDDKSHEQQLALFDKHGKGLKDTKWVLQLSHLRAVLVLLEVLDVFCKHSARDLEQETTSYRLWLVERAQFSLQSLRLITLVYPQIALEVCTTTLTNSQRNGLSILLECAMSSHFRDGDIVRDAMHVFGNCVLPITMELSKKMKDDTTLKQNLRSILKLARDKSAIKVCLSLLRYKRSLQHADSIRFLAARALLGLSRDRHIAQILEQMQVGQLLSDLIRNDPVLEENADIHARFREVALELISHVSQRAPSAAITEATDPTIRKIEKANIVASTRITYNPTELLLMIHDHLKTHGLTQAADALEAEAQLKVPSNAVPLKPSVRRSKSCDDATAISPSTSPRPLKRLRFDMRPVKLSFAQRKKHMASMIKKSHYFKAHAEASSPKKVSKTVEKKKEPKTSWLDGLVQQYCREQHRQCSHPVSIVPPFSLSSTTPHICPDVSTPSLVSNIHNRLVTRSAFGSSARVDPNTTRFVFSRHRAFRVVGHGSDLQGSLTSARFLGPPNDLDMLMGTDRGELCRLNLEQDTIVGTWQCHNDAGPLTSICTNEHTRMLFSNSNPLVLTGTSRLNQYEQAVIGLWDLGHMETPRWTLPGMRSGQFNFTGDRIVAMSFASENQFDPSLSSPIRGTGIYEVETGTLLTQMDTRANSYGDDTNCAFSPCDSMVLADGMLWDLRVSKSLHQFDKLSNFGYGFFHPAGNEVIINSAVWDLRTFKLLRLVPSLEQCRVQFNQTGSILYAYTPFEPVMKETSKKALKQKTWFRVLDARDYKDISTVDVERPIYDLSLNAQETLLSIVEGRYLDSVYGEDDPVCRLYEIGRSKPNEADSDLEDNVEESDSMEDFEDESNSSGDEENEDDNSASVDELSEYSGSDSSQDYDTDYDELFPADADVMRLEIPDNAYLTFGSEYDEDDEEDDSGESSTSEEED